MYKLDELTGILIVFYISILLLCLIDDLIVPVPVSPSNRATLLIPSSRAPQSQATTEIHTEVCEQRRMKKRSQNNLRKLKIEIGIDNYKQYLFSGLSSGLLALCQKFAVCTRIIVSLTPNMRTLDRPARVFGGPIWLEYVIRVALSILPQLLNIP